MSSICVFSGNSSVIRRSYVTSLSSVWHYTEQINFVPVTEHCTKLTSNRDGICPEIRSAGKPLSRPNSRSYSPSSTSEDGTTYVQKVTFVVGLDNFYVTANVRPTGQSTSGLKVNIMERSKDKVTN